MRLAFHAFVWCVAGLLNEGYERDCPASHTHTEHPRFPQAFSQLGADMIGEA